VRGRIAVGTTSFQIVLNDPAGAGSWNATTRTDFGGNGVSSGTLISTATDTQGNTAGPSGSVTVATASNLPSHNHAVVASAANGFNATAIENRPTFLSVFYIMRIK
jgi:microcystin-dependent protein